MKKTFLYGFMLFLALSFSSLVHAVAVSQPVPSAGTVDAYTVSTQAVAVDSAEVAHAPIAGILPVYRTQSSDLTSDVSLNDNTPSAVAENDAPVACGGFMVRTDAVGLGKATLSGA